MVKLNVRLDVQQAKRSLKGLEAEVGKAAMRALDRVATTVRKEAADEISKSLNLKKGTIKGALTQARPYGRSRLVRDVVAQGNPIPLRDFAARQTARGVTYKVKRGGSRKIYRAKGNTAFQIDRLGRHVFVRTEPDPPGERKGRIRKVHGPSITQYFQARFVRTRMLRTAQERWPIEFEREINFRKRKAGII